MAKRSARKRDERPAWWFYLFLFGLGAFLVHRFQGVLEAHARIIVPALLFVLSLLVVNWGRRWQRAASLEAVDRMEGHEFERYLVKLFRKQGFATENVGQDGADFGADLIIEKEGIRIAVQAKNYTSGRVGNDAVQQAIAGATYYACDQAMVITNSRYTKSAYQQAKGCHNFPVILWDRDEMTELISK